MLCSINSILKRETQNREPGTDSHETFSFMSTPSGSKKFRIRNNVPSKTCIQLLHFIIASFLQINPEESYSIKGNRI